MQQKIEEEGLLWIPRERRLDLATPKESKDVSRVLKYSQPAVAITGAPDGSILQSMKGGGQVQLIHVGTSCKHTVTLHGKQVPIFPACGLWVQQLLKTNREAYLCLLKDTPWITGTDEEKAQQLRAISDSYANHTLLGMTATPGEWRIKVLKLPSHMEEAFDNATIVEWIESQSHLDPHEVETAYGSAKGTKRATIALRRGQWRVVPTVVDNTMKKVYALESTGNVYKVSFPVRDSKDTIQRQETIGIRAEQGCKPSNIIEMVEHYADLLLPSVTYVKQQCQRLETLHTKYRIGTSWNKSLQQKLIRYQPLRCELSGIWCVDASVALLYVMARILLSPPQFIPNIQASVNGVVNTVKRLLVQAFEDSNPTVLGTEALNQLAMVSLLAHHVPEWFPSEGLLKIIFGHALALQDDTTTFAYQTSKSYRVQKKKFHPANPWVAAMVLRSLRAFKGDMNMVDWYANHWMNLTPYQLCRRGSRPSIMPYPQHGLDQHVVPNLAFLIPGISPNASSQPFAPVMQALFKQVTGVNPRRGMELGDVAWARQAQNMYLKLLLPPTMALPSNLRPVTLTMSKAWFAGALGSVPLPYVIQGKRVPPLAFTLHADLESIHVTPVPSRNMKPEEAEDIMNNEALLQLGREEAERIMAKGVRLTAIPKLHLPRSCLYNAILKKDHDKYVVRLNEKWVDCDALCQWHSSVPSAVIAYPTFSTHLLEGDYEGNMTDKELTTFFKTYPADRSVLQRALSTMATRAAVIGMPKLDRSGGTMGTSPATVSMYDGEVFRFFLCLSRLVPSALRPHPTRPFYFQVDNIAYFRQVRDLLHGCVAGTSTKSCFDCTTLYDRRTRTLFNHQEASVVRMLQDMEQGMTSLFLYLQVGLGKTLIVLEFLRRAFHARSLNTRHIIYTAPKSAMGSTVREIVDYGFEVDLLTAKQSHAIDAEYRRISGVTVFSMDSQWNAPRPGKVTVIHHDGLRRVKDKLLRYIDQGIFINDEVHKTLNVTLRTATALELARLSKMCIAFTGTPILTVNGADLLVKWLQSFVHFSINKRNFGVAMNGVVAYRVETGKKVIETVVDVPYSPSQQVKEKKQLDQGQFFDAIQQAYAHLYHAMVKEAVKRLDQGVLVVARDQDHQKKLCRAMVQEKDAKVCCLLGDPKWQGVGTIRQLLYLTSDAVRRQEEEAFNVVVVCQNHCEGYDASHLATMVTSVYPSNLATRVQMFGRINRVVQESACVERVVMVAGVLRQLHENYETAKTVFKCLHSKAVKKKEELRQLLTKRKRS